VEQPDDIDHVTPVDKMAIAAEQLPDSNVIKKHGCRLLVFPDPPVS
jgi:hypothetical protein